MNGKHARRARMATLFAFLHHAAAFTLVAALAVEFALIRGELTLPTARKLQVADIVLGVAATILLVVGLLRVFYFEKGAAYYWHSHAFLGKFSIFVIVAALSAVPTIEFLSWRDAVKAGQAPVVLPQKLARVRLIIHAELAGVVLILLFAAIMAKGGWN
jgi:putative membrane protein